MAEIYQGNKPGEILAKLREAVTSREEEDTKNPSYWAQYGTTREDLDSNVEPEICKKDAKELEERELDEQGCMGASNLLATAARIYRDPHKPRGGYRFQD